MENRYPLDCYVKGKIRIGFVGAAWVVDVMSVCWVTEQPPLVALNVVADIDLDEYTKLNTFTLSVMLFYEKR